MSQSRDKGKEKVRDEVKQLLKKFNNKFDNKNVEVPTNIGNASYYSLPAEMVVKIASFMPTIEDIYNMSSVNTFTRENLLTEKTPA